MCRLILATCDAIKDYEKKHGLLDLLDHLETECGGHGNGYALFTKKGRLIKLEKGVNLANIDIAPAILKTDYEYLIYHTRIASVGEIHDDRCHPYIQGDIALAMNGTLSGLSSIAETLDKTDTEIMLSIISGLQLEEAVKVLNTTSSVFVGMYQDVPLVLKNNGALCEYTGYKQGILFASSLPVKVKEHKSLPCGFRYVGGARHIPKEEKALWDYMPYTGSKLYRLYAPYKTSSYKPAKKVITSVKKTIKEAPVKTITDYTSKTGDEYWLGYDEGFNEGYDIGKKDGIKEGFCDGIGEAWGSYAYINDK
ncbi:MAG: hypothetical protein LBS75_00975 [Synergistaceae bacterium]|jgi:predicted glutamine amidotransferase|nr:hypothetical protein [Synergistaceae bacterium]